MSSVYYIPKSLIKNNNETTAQKSNMSSQINEVLTLKGTVLALVILLAAIVLLFCIVFICIKKKIRMSFINKDFKLKINTSDANASLNR